MDKLVLSSNYQVVVCHVHLNLLDQPTLIQWFYKLPLVISLQCHAGKTATFGSLHKDLDALVFLVTFQCALQFYISAHWKVPLWHARGGSLGIEFGTQSVGLSAVTTVCAFLVHSVFLKAECFENSCEADAVSWFVKVVDLFQMKSPDMSLSTLNNFQLLRLYRIGLLLLIGFSCSLFELKRLPSWEFSGRFYSGITQDPGIFIEQNLNLFWKGDIWYAPFLWTLYCMYNLWTSNYDSGYLNLHFSFIGSWGISFRFPQLFSSFISTYCLAMATLWVMLSSINLWTVCCKYRSSPASKNCLCPIQFT